MRSTVAAATAVCFSGTGNSVPGLHHRFGLPFLGEGLRPLYFFKRSGITNLFGEPYYCRLLTNGFSMSTTLPRSQRYMRVFASSAGTASGVRRCVADLLWLWRYRGLLHSRVPPQTGRYRRYSKEVFSLADFYSGPFSSNPLRDPGVTAFVKMAVSFSKAARGSTILLQENRRRRRLPVRSISIPKSSFPS